MTPLDFQKKHLANFSAFLNTEMGRDLLQVLHDLRMAPSCEGVEHQVVYRHGSIAGYEQCERNILGLATAPKTAIKPVAQNYGVKDPGPKDEGSKA